MGELARFANGELRIGADLHGNIGPQVTAQATAYVRTYDQAYIDPRQSRSTRSEAVASRGWVKKRANFFSARISGLKPSINGPEYSFMNQ